MKLIFLYGPPAVGKLTIGRELEALTGFRLLHNHLLIDLITPVFGSGSMSYLKLLRQFGVSMLKEAARVNLPGIITTFVYSPSRLSTVEQYEEAVMKNSGEVCYVRLYCDRTILAQRIVGEDRRKYSKITNVVRLNKKLKELEEPFALLADRESLSLDVGKLTPLKAAESIKKHYHLPQATLTTLIRPTGYSQQYGQRTLPVGADDLAEAIRKEYGFSRAAAVRLCTTVIATIRNEMKHSCPDRRRDFGSGIPEFFE